MKDNKTIIPIGNSRVALYFIRNPLDISISFAHHQNTSIDEIIHLMNEKHILSEIKKFPEYFVLQEELMNWSNHVLSWVNNSSIPIEIIRYEDMHLKPLETFERAVKAIGLTHSKEQIQKAIDIVSFKNLKKQERLTPFKEKGNISKPFFRKGIINSWKEELNSTQIKKIIDNHREVMLKFNYDVHYK